MWHFTVLRCAGEHLNEVVVQRIVQLALKVPVKLRMFKIARMNGESIRVNRDG